MYSIATGATVWHIHFKAIGPELHAQCATVQLCTRSYIIQCSHACAWLLAIAIGTRYTLKRRICLALAAVHRSWPDHGLQRLQWKHACAEASVNGVTTQNRTASLRRGQSTRAHAQKPVWEFRAKMAMVRSRSSWSKTVIVNGVTSRSLITWLLATMGSYVFPDSESQETRT